MNFERKVRRLNEDSYWSPIPRIYDISACRSPGRSTVCAACGPARISVSSRTRSAAPTRSGASATRRRFRRRVRREVRRHERAHLGLHGQHRFLAGRGRRAADQPVALQPVLSGEARLLPRELRHLPVRRRRRRICGGGGGGGGGAAGGRTRGDTRLFFSRRIGLSDDGERDSDPRRHATDRPPGRLLDWLLEHSAALAR